MTYFQYLFSDKKAKVYWISVYAVIFGFPVFILFLHPELIKELNFRDILNVLGIVIIYGSIYVGFYTSGYLNYRLQKRFENLYSSIIDDAVVVSVVIYQDKFTIKAYHTNIDAKMPVQPRFDEYRICIIGNSLVILGQVYDLGVFRRHMHPIQVDLKEEQTDKLKHVDTPNISSVDFTENDLIIRFRKSVNAINKMVVKDFKKYMRTNK